MFNFNRWKLRTKVLVGPLIAVLGFTVTFFVNYLTGQEVSRLSSDIKDSYVPGLQLINQLQADIGYQADEGTQLGAVINSTQRS